jgi:hypothetical protein
MLSLPKTIYQPHPKRNDMEAKDLNNGYSFIYGRKRKPITVKFCMTLKDRTGTDTGCNKIYIKTSEDHVIILQEHEKVFLYEPYKTLQPQ